MGTTDLSQCGGALRCGLALVKQQGN